MSTDTNDDATQAMLAEIERAMRAEHEGYHFYLMAARSTSDDKARAVFEQLARDERKHYEFLARQLAALTDTGSLDADVVLDEPPVVDPEDSIFSEELKQRLDQAHFEVTALSIGMQLELDAVRGYRAAAEQAPDPEVKKLLTDLAAWESTHYQRLLAQQNELKEEYWFNARFAPF